MWGLVLAGGEGRRMGGRKQDLAFGGETLLERVVRLARRTCEEVLIVGDRSAAARLGAGAAADLEPGAGPLSALAGGLAACPDGLHALLACDLPFLDPGLLPRLEALAGPARAVVPRVGGRRHPLCGLYHRDCQEAAAASVARGRRSMDDLLARVPVRFVGPEEVLPVSLIRSVTNLNTPEEYRCALAELEGGDHER